MTFKNAFFTCFLITYVVFAQKPQRIGYVDMEYVFENIPAYAEIQNNINDKSDKWQTNVERKTKALEKLKSELDNERVILTDAIIEEKEDEIKTLELEIKEMKSRYFGPEGALFKTRQQLIKPLQDQVFNAIQKIVKNKGYDFVFERQGAMLMLHANPRYDISKLVIDYVTKSQKQIEIEEAQRKKEERKKMLQKRVEDLKKKRKEREKNTIYR